MCSPTDPLKIAAQVDIETTADETSLILREGRRDVSLAVLADSLKSCTKCGQWIHLADCVGKSMFGLGSIMFGLGSILHVNAAFVTSSKTSQR